MNVRWLQPISGAIGADVEFGVVSVFRSGFCWPLSGSLAAAFMYVPDVVACLLHCRMHAVCLLKTALILQNVMLPCIKWRIYAATGGARPNAAWSGITLPFIWLAQN